MWLNLKTICEKKKLYKNFNRKKQQITFNTKTKTGLLNLTKLQKYISLQYYGNKNWFNILETITKGPKKNGF